MSDRNRIRSLGSVASLAAFVLPTLLAAAPPPKSLRLRLEETAGLRRFGYPVHVLLPPSAAGGHYRLTRNGRDVPAQFTSIREDDGTEAVALDFNTSAGPRATEEYRLVLISGSSQRNERGLRIEHAAGEYQISNGSALRYVVPDDLSGFLKRVSGGRNEYLNDGSDGLSYRDKQARIHRLGGRGADRVEAKATITRQGPLAIGLRFEAAVPRAAGRGVASVVALSFPSSKSWVETSWTIDDPSDDVGALLIDLSLKLEGTPVLVDFGTSSTIYGTLRGNERMELSAGRLGPPSDARGPWTIRKGQDDAMSDFAQATRPDSAPAEGWAHAMDRARCTALAIEDFGRSSRDRIEILASGRVRIERQFASGPQHNATGRKSIHFWFHFVPMPVQIGALTSPQSMLAPLKVTWLDRDS